MPTFIRWLLDLLPSNPIVVRIVQGASRRSRHLYIRAGYLAVLIIALLVMLLGSAGGGTIQFRDLAQGASSAFVLTAYLQVGLICVLAPVLMAGAIAQESSPRTWEVLLTTPLSATQIVFGQLAGRLVFVLALLFASTPLFAVTQYFGGVPASAVLTSYAVAACAALVVGAIAVALSVNRLAGRRAVFTFYVAVVTYLGLTLAIDLYLRPGQGVTVMTPLNPFLALNALVDPVTYARPGVIELAGMTAFERFWFGTPVTAWCAVSSGASLLLVLISATTARSLGSKTGVPLWRRLLGKGSPSAERYRAPRTVGQNPIAWWESSARQATLGKAMLRWGFLAAGVMWGVVLIGMYHTGTLNADDVRFWMLTTIWTETVVILLVAINMSATAISKEREDGTLDLVLTTPITPSYYLGGKLLGLVTYLLPLAAVPLLTIGAGAVYTLFGGFGGPGVMIKEPSPSTVTAPLVLPEAAIAAPLSFLPFLAFVVMIGLGRSLGAKGALSGVVATVASVAVAGGVVGLCGWKAAEQVPFIGPGLAALNPFTTFLAAVEPGTAMAATASGTSGGGLTGARVSLFAGAAVSVGVYLTIVLGMRTSMDKSFDVTTRRLAGRA